MNWRHQDDRGRGNTILADRRVVPPDLIRSAARVADLEKGHEPEDLPPPRQRLVLAAKPEKLEPLPEPYLKMRASRVQRSMIPSRH